MLLPREIAQFGGEACVSQLKSLSRVTFCVALFFLFSLRQSLNRVPFAKQ